MQVTGTDSSFSHDSGPGGAAGHHHALFNDYNLTEPFGVVNAAAGIIGLFFKVEACPKHLPAVCTMLCSIASDVATSKMQCLPLLCSLRMCFRL